MIDSYQTSLNQQNNPEISTLKRKQSHYFKSSSRESVHLTPPSEMIKSPTLGPKTGNFTFSEIDQPSSPNHSANNRLNSVQITDPATFTPNARPLVEKRKNKKEEVLYYYNKCLIGISHSINIIKAVMMRVIFSLHSLIAIVYVFLVKKDEWYFINIVGVVFMIIELFVTIIKRKGREPRWFFPCFFIYICTMIPPIWFIELSRINQANARRRDNSTDTDPLESLLMLSENLVNKDLIGGVGVSLSKFLKYEL